MRMWSPVTAALHQPQLGPILVPFFLQQTRKKKTHIVHMANGNCYVQNCALVTTDYPKHLSWLKTCWKLKVFDCTSSHWVFPASHYYPCHGQHLQTWVCHLSRNPGWFFKVLDFVSIQSLYWFLIVFLFLCLSYLYYPYLHWENSVKRFNIWKKYLSQQRKVTFAMSQTQLLSPVTSFLLYSENLFFILTLCTNFFYVVPFAYTLPLVL